MVFGQATIQLHVPVPAIDSVIQAGRNAGALKTDTLVLTRSDVFKQKADTGFVRANYQTKGSYLGPNDTLGLAPRSFVSTWFLSQANATATYLSIVNAASTYLSQSSAASTYSCCSTR